MVRLATYQTRDSVSTAGPQRLYATLYHPAVDDRHIESVAANAFEQLWCIASCIGRDRRRLGHILENLITITFQERYIPIELDPKSIALRLGIGNVAKQHSEIKTRPSRQFAKHRDLVLNGMTGDERDSVGHERRCQVSGTPCSPLFPWYQPGALPNEKTGPKKGADFSGQFGENVPGMLQVESREDFSKGSAKDVAPFLQSAGALKCKVIVSYTVVWRHRRQVVAIGSSASSLSTEVVDPRLGLKDDFPARPTKTFAEFVVESIGDRWRKVLVKTADFQCSGSPDAEIPRHPVFNKRFLARSEEEITIGKGPARRRVYVLHVFLLARLQNLPGDCPDLFRVEGFVVGANEPLIDTDVIIQEQHVGLRRVRESDVQCCRLRWLRKSQPSYLTIVFPVAKSIVRLLFAGNRLVQDQYFSRRWFLTK